MFLSHDGLEMATGILAISGTGWLAYAQLQRSRLEEKIQDNAKMLEAQWIKIDGLRTEAKDYLTRDKHEASIKDIYVSIERAIEISTKPLIESINRLSDKLDRLILERK